MTALDAQHFAARLFAAQAEAERRERTVAELREHARLCDSGARQTRAGTYIHAQFATMGQEARTMIARLDRGRS